mgnify:FL=1
MRYEDVEWQAAACKGIQVDMFYLETLSESLTYTPTLRRICRDCPIFEDCREYAFEHEVHGFWGGLTATERRNLRSQWRVGKYAA